MTNMPPAASPVTGDEKRGWRIIVYILLFAAAIAAYWSILNNTLTGDDFAEIKRLYDIPVTELWRLFEINAPSFMRPVAYFLYWLQYRLFGLEALPSHLINVGLHAGTACLLLSLMLRMGIGRLPSVLSAALFVLTPLAPEAVTWSDGRFDTSSLFFIMLTLVLYVSFLKSGSRLAFAAALLAAAAAFLSKETGVILVALVPATELLFAVMPKGKFTREDLATKARLRQAILRVLPFVVLIAFLFLLRLEILGGLGGYSQVRQFGIPGIRPPIRSILTLMAPLDRLMFPESTINALRLYVGALYGVSLMLVIFRWKKADIQARRLWLIFALLFVSSVLPVYGSFFLEGLTNYLNNSRFFYIPDLAFIAALVLGLYEFGWRYRPWRAAVTIALLALIPVYFWGLNHNNRIWERTAAINYHIITETKKQVPDPPPGSKFYFLNIPIADGAHFYANGIPETIAMNYDRADLQVYYLNPDPIFRVNYAAYYGPTPNDGYVFEYDRETDQLKLVQEPASP